MELSLKALFIYFTLYFILSTIFYRYNVFSQDSIIPTIFTVFGGIILVMLLIMGLKKDFIYNFQSPGLSGDELKNIGKATLIIGFGLMLTLGLITIIFTFLKTPPSSTAFFSVFNVLIFLTTVSLFLYFVKDVESGNPYFMLFKNIVMYLPCLFYNFIDWVKEQYNITTSTAYIILGIDIFLIFIEKAWSKIKNLFRHSTPGHTLLEGPIFLDKRTGIGTYEDLKPSDPNKNFQYHFGLSFKIYINPQPPNTSASYTEYYTIFNYGDKPRMLYKADDNKLKIQVKMNEKETKNIYLGNDLKLQKWNHFIINYDGGTMDVFLNDELISSSSSIAPYMTWDNVTAGEENGIHGGIKDVVYFRKPIQ